MLKFQKALKAILMIARKPVLLNRVLQDPDTWKEYVIRKFGISGGLPVIDVANLFGNSYRENLSVFTFLDGGSMVTDIALLKSLAAQIPGCKYFEIGTWRGESAVNLADAADEVYTLNISDEEMRRMGVNESYISQQGFFSKGKKKIRHLRYNSRNFDFSSPGKKFDLIFIDGSHHYEDVRDDTEKIFNHLVHNDTIVVWHDYAVTPEDIRYEVFAGMLDGLPQDLHKYLYHVGHTKSAIFTRKEFPSETLRKPEVPGFYYSVEIKYQRVEKG